LAGRVLLGVASAAACAGCSSSTVAKSLDQPIQALNATDVALETTLQAVQQVAETQYAIAHTYSTFSAGAGGVSVTNGPSPGPGQTSWSAVASGQAIVLALWNKADIHCVGMITIKQAISPPVLGESSPGTYYFVAPALTSSACDAAVLAENAVTPPGWVYNPSPNPDMHL
jgi:hypothetical protein